MEWMLLLLFTLVAAAVIGLPWAPWSDADAEPAEASVATRSEERRRLLAELRDLNDDAAAGRISAQDRREGRRALAPRLRAVTEALRAAAAEAGPDQATDGEVAARA
jgi:hypothetical protein